MRLMKALPLVLAALLLPAPAVGSSHAPHITDPEGDIQVTAWPSVDVPDPSIDILAVTFGREGDNLTVVIRVADLGYAMPYAGRVEHKAFNVHFEGDVHASVTVGASYQHGHGWRASIMCFDEALLVSCYEDLAPPALDHAEDELRIEAPLDAFGGRVLRSQAGSWVTYRNVPDAWPHVALQDYAPNCSLPPCARGADYDPHA